MTGVTQLVQNYRFSASEFVRAWEAGAFDRHVELVEGEVWPVVIGGWHGRTVGTIIARLQHPGAVITTATLPAGESLTDPDCWLVRDGAQPIGMVGSRVEVWAPADVLLVVEVSDATVLADLTTKARLYGSAGYPVYWVVTEDVVYEHTEPKDGGFASRREYTRGERIPLRHAGSDVGVDDILGPVAP